jgi:hypothetical protein
MMNTRLYKIKRGGGNNGVTPSNLKKLGILKLTLISKIQVLD